METGTAEHAVRFFDYITLIAVFLGPIAAVFVTRWIDGRREKRTRRLDLFKALMRTRGSRLNPEHVGALNLIEIEYYKEQRVLDSLEKYFQHLNDNSHQHDAGTWLTKMDQLFTKLLYEIAKSLKYEIEQLQILTGGYAPKAWQESENQQKAIQVRLLDVLEGRTALLVQNGATSVREQSVPFTVPPGFPPPPAN